MTARGVICWDLDETLGNFRPVADELIARMRPLGRIRTALGFPPRAPIELREGVPETLARLRDAGFVQVVTTGSLIDYAEHGLRRVGIRSFFAEVYGRDTIWEGWGKSYATVRARFGTPPERMLVIGDDFKKDRASDHLDTVMICDQLGLRKSASLIPPLVEALAGDDADGCDFRAGWDRLHRRAERDGLEKWVEVGSVRATIARWGNFARNETTPVLSDLRAREASADPAPG